MMMLDDDDYNESIRGIITEQSVNAQYAVSVTCENFAQMFTQMSDPYMQARAADVKDISGRLIACMDDDICTIDSGTDKRKHFCGWVLTSFRYLRRLYCRCVKKYGRLTCQSK